MSGHGYVAAVVSRRPRGWQWSTQDKTVAFLKNKTNITGHRQNFSTMYAKQVSCSHLTTLIMVWPICVCFQYSYWQRALKMYIEAVSRKIKIKFVFVDIFS